MTFAYPWMLMLGVVAAAAPLAIHWLTRPRPTRMPLSTLRFVREAIRQRRATHRLRDFIILALRTVAILLIAAAFAGPRWGEPSLIDDDAAGDTDRIVLLDVSQSMGATFGNAEVLQRARTTAAQYLQYRPGLRANLLLVAAEPQPIFDTASTNFESLRDELSRARSLPQRANVTAALESAARQLAPQSDQDERRRELVIISDFQRTNWATAAFEQFPPGTKIQLESVATSPTAANLGITRVACRPLGSRQERMLLEVDIGNYSPAARKVTVEVTLGQGVFRFTAACPPRVVTTLAEEVALSDQIRGASNNMAGGWLWGTAQLLEVNDALATDDVRPLIVQLHGEPSYALVTEDAPRRQASSNLILKSVLLPEVRSDEESRRLATILPSTIDNESFAAADLIAVNRCGLLSEDATRVLAMQLRRGRPILYVASQPVDATNLARLATAAGLEMPVQFAPPTAGLFRRDLVLTSVRQEQQPFSVFGAGLPAVLKQLRFSGGLLTQQTGGNSALDESVLARYGDGTAALVVVGSDGAALAVLNADLAASNVWKTEAFVPIVEELLQRLLPQNSAGQNYASGEPLVIRLPTTTPAEQLQIVPAVAQGAIAQDAANKDSGSRSTAAESKAADLGQLVDAGATALWQWKRPGAPDVYCIQDKNQTIYAAAVTLPAEESDLSSLPPDVIQQRLAAGQEVYYRADRDMDAERHELWKWFAVACVLAMLAEVGVLLFFRT